jgi:hypothetical protein
MSQAQQPNNQEDEFNRVPSNTWYIKHTHDGQIKGKIQFQTTSLLEIVPADIPEQIDTNQEQIREKVSPRFVTIQAAKSVALTGDQDPLPRLHFDHYLKIQGVHCEVFSLTPEEHGEVIWARQEGYIVTCKWRNFYYKGGKEKGSYCTITHLREENPKLTLPNWKFYCVGHEIKSGNIETHQTYSITSELEKRIYRVTKVEIPIPEEGREIVNRIKQVQTVEDLLY